MLTITNVKVYDLRESIIASGNAMRTEPCEYNSDYEYLRGIQRITRLVRTSQKTDVHCHDNALCGIRVSFDIKYPQYWTPEFQRYHFADIVTSSSKMHRLLQMDLNTACNEYVTMETKENLLKYINEYNALTAQCAANKTQNTAKSKELVYNAWMKVLSNTPLGLELFMRVSTNYKQLQTIYFQRRNHKLKEWHIFCKMIEELPFFKQFILGED